MQFPERSPSIGNHVNIVLAVAALPELLRAS